MSSIDFGPMDLALRPFTLEASSDADVKKEEEDDSWE